MNNKKREPLNLPAGSIRALLALASVAVVLFQLSVGRPVEVIWKETLMIVLAHYFSTRRFIDLSPRAIELLREQGILEDERHPLFMPKYTIRFLIAISFLGVGFFLYKKGRLFNNVEALSLIGAVIIYFLGFAFRKLVLWFFHSERSSTIWWINDIKALVVLIPVLIFVAATFLGLSSSIPESIKGFVPVLILFYFGSR